MTDFEYGTAHTNAVLATSNIGDRQSISCIAMCGSLDFLACKTGNEARQHAT